MEGLKPEIVIKILQKHNVDVSLEEAGKILDFMIKLAKLTLNQKEEI